MHEAVSSGTPAETAFQARIAMKRGVVIGTTQDRMQRPGRPMPSSVDPIRIPANKKKGQACWGCVKALLEEGDLPMTQASRQAESRNISVRIVHLGSEMRRHAQSME